MRAKLFILALSLAASLNATVISQSIINGDQTPWAGQIDAVRVSGALGSQYVIGGKSSKRVNGGSLLWDLAPGVYSVVYTPSRNGLPYWTVPSVGGPYTISQVESLLPPTAGVAVAPDQMRPLGTTGKHGTYAPIPYVDAPAGTTDLFTCPALKLCISQSAPGTFNTGESAVYFTGTVTLTQNSTTVTGSGTTFTSSMVGGIFYSGGKQYFIATYVSATSITLNTPWSPSTATGASYSIAYGTIQAQYKVKHSGTYYGIHAQSNALAVGSVTVQNPSGSGSWTGLPLQAGDTLAVTTTGVGLICRGAFLILDAANSGFTALWNYGLPLGYTTIYTVPAGKSAQLGGATFGDAPTTTNQQMVFFYTNYVYGFPEIVPAGQVPDFRFIGGNTASSATGPGKSSMTLGGIMGPGDSLVVYIDGTAADAGQTLYYGLVKEAYIDN